MNPADTTLAKPAEPSTSPTPSTPSKQRRVSSSLRSGFSNWGLLFVFAAVIALFWALNPSVFPTSSNVQTIALTQSTVGLVALAVTVPIIAGQFDLSAGYQYGLAQTLCSVLIINSGFSPVLTIFIVLAAGALIGLVNGLLVTQLNLPSFTTTLGTGILVLGITELISGEQIITGTMPNWFLGLGRNSLLGIPLPFIYLIVIAAVLLFLFEFTIWGRRVYATGNNPEAALLSGINTNKVTIQCFVTASMLPAIAGCLSVMSLGGSSPVVGLGALLPAFAATFLGATSIRAGRYNIAGTIVAVYLLGTGITGLQQLGAQTYIEDVFNGAALLIAIILASLAARRRGLGSQS